MQNKPLYVLGTGCSHDGSACLLKDGKIIVAIEKERITRKKHDGFNDTKAIQYCLSAAGITMNDIDLVVQNSACYDTPKDHFNGERIFAKHPDIPFYTISHHQAHAYSTIGTSPFRNNFNIMIIDGTGCSFDQCLDLSATQQYDACITSFPHLFFEKDSYYSYRNGSLTTVYKDFSEFGLGLKNREKYAGSKHSIGSVYEMFSKYCFGNMQDTGKLMGLAPYGHSGVFNAPLFELSEGRLWVNYDTIDSFQNPARSHTMFKQNFQYYADVALYVQKEAERALLYIFESRLALDYAENLAYAGGVALNAVANAKMLDKLKVSNLYMQPAAGDNGIAIGCAFYGWLEVLKKEPVTHNASTFFGKPYSNDEILTTLKNSQVYETLAIRQRVDDFFCELEKHKINTSLSGIVCQIDVSDIGIYQLVFSEDKVKVYDKITFKPTTLLKLDGQSFMKGLQHKQYFEELLNSGQVKIVNPGELAAIGQLMDLESIYHRMPPVQTGDQVTTQPLRYRKTNNRAKEVAQLLADGKVIGLFQGGAEFGPRALGHRSIVADPRIKNVRNFINGEIKLREDFRPFAPAVLKEDLLIYFKKNQESPYMILVNEVKEEWKDVLESVIHKDNSSRVQTVTKGWNSSFHEILTEFKELTGLSVLLNTSFNKKGMPIVETPQEALTMFMTSKLDCLVMEDYIIEKMQAPQPKLNSQLQESVN